MQTKTAKRLFKIATRLFIGTLLIGWTFGVYYTLAGSVTERSIKILATIICLTLSAGVVSILIPLFSAMKSVILFIIKNRSKLEN